MDPRLDPQLALLSETAASSDETLDELAASGFFGIEALAGESPPGRRGKADEDEVLVLVQCSGEADDLREAGLTIRSEIGDVFTGTIAVGKLGDLAEVDGVELIESSREMFQELDLATADTGVGLVHQGPPGRRGNGVLIGIVDSGIDFTHPTFRRDDGTSRILSIWDQGLTRQGSETQPGGFPYGVEYTNNQINAALQNATPFNVVRHRDPGGHGTHVAGIAAGDGSSAGQGQPAFTFVGVAPEAELIVVRTGSGPEGMGTSANALDAVNYCYQRAQALGRPIVVNMSLGDNLGPHDGTSLLERGIDNLLGGPGRAFVKSAGNVGSARHHAGGNVAAGATVDVGFLEPNGNTTPDQLDLWYAGGDTFRAAVVDAAGNATGWVNVGTATTFTLTGGNTVRIDHRNNDTFNGDKRLFITIQRGSAATIRPGNWSVRLRSVASPTGGRFDAWIQRHNTVNQRPTFTAPFESNDRTISTPGTGQHVITAANYITRGPGVGSLAASSSRGPTRDGRAAPTIAAPGGSIVSARSEPGSGDPYVGMSGTSMAAPHIAGIIALMLQRTPTRTQQQIRRCLTDSARTDAFTGPVPNTAWGAGKVDAEAAVRCGRVVPTVSVVTSCPSIIRVTCPSLVAVTCRTLAGTCRSVVQVDCLQVSVPVVTCPQRSVPQVTCPQVSVPAAACPRVSVVACPSLADGCPSTPGGCIPDPTVIRDPGPVIREPVVREPVVRPPAYAAEGQEPLEGWTASATWQQAPELPPEGYYEYDERWFDGDDD
jgi:subtilisin family serine protease